jgi:hypothetical protein
VAFATPANAAGCHLKESIGDFRVGAPDLSDFAPAVETGDGRVVHFVDVQTGQVKIEFDAGPGLCVAASDSGVRAMVHDCNGQLGTVWIEQSSGGHLQFEAASSSPAVFTCAAGTTELSS